MDPLRDAREAADCKRGRGTESFAAMLTADLDVAGGWGRRGHYSCPACGSDQVARERLMTTRYPGRNVTVEHSIRCMTCGEEAEEG